MSGHVLCAFDDWESRGFDHHLTDTFANYCFPIDMRL